MKNIFTLILLCQIVAYAQYNNEVTTEESFEQSELYFQSHYLNPYGILNFEKVSPGLINNQFLNLYVNPADLPNLDTSNALVYLDFRGAIQSIQPKQIIGVKQLAGIVRKIYISVKIKRIKDENN